MSILSGINIFQDSKIQFYTPMLVMIVCKNLELHQINLETAFSFSIDN